MSERVWHENGAIVSDHLPPIPARSLTASIDGDELALASASGLVLFKLPYWRFRDAAGASFASAAEAKAYFDGEFAKASTEPGDGLALVGNEMRIDISSLEQAP